MFEIVIKINDIFLANGSKVKRTIGTRNLFKRTIEIDHEKE
jgi:hypothetical protein